MMAGNPNWWSMHPQSSQLSINNPQKFVYGGSNYVVTSSSASSADDHSLSHDFPSARPWSQLLLTILHVRMTSYYMHDNLSIRGEDDRYGDDSSGLQQQKNWEEQVSIFNNPCNSLTTSQAVLGYFDVKEEQLVTSTCHLYDARSRNGDEIFHQQNTHTSKQATDYNLTASSSGLLNFVEGNKNQNQHQHNQYQSSECNGTSNLGGVSKKARVQHSSSQPALKVRKEKLGDRITALHQLVSPFGKTDTASVLSEAFACIRFLQSQIEAMSSPYMRKASARSSTSQIQRSELGSRHGDLRSRGLCLVPISICTQNVGHVAAAADYWAPNYH